MDVLRALATAFWFILPAYVANSSPVVLGGGTPIDLGKKFIDGKPLFGPGKTIRGFIGGVLAGTLTGVILALLHPYVWIEEPLPGLSTLSIYLQLSFLLSSGALIGDLVGSFIKRRLDIPRGEPAALLDQLDFLITAVLFAGTVIWPPKEILFILLVVTPFLHWGTNVLAFKLGLKDKPY